MSLSPHEPRGRGAPQASEAAAAIRLAPPSLRREEEAAPAGPPPRIRGPGLAARLLMLVIGALVLIQTMIYVSRLSAFHENWLRDKFSAVGAAVIVISRADETELSAGVAEMVLAAAGAKKIVSEKAGRRSLMAGSDSTVEATESFDLREPSLMASLQGTVRTLFAPPGTILSVTGWAPYENETLQIILDESPLTASMWRFTRVFLGISLTLSTIVAAVLWLLIWVMVLRPVRRLTSNILAFRESPHEPARVIAPSGRRDEIGAAEMALASMQTSLTRELAQKKRLAELGLAVARINHDLRNMLSAAQLISDRLATIPDPLAVRLAPRLVATLDRAIAFCQSTLTYGGAVERAPARRRFALRPIVEQVVETAKAGGAGDIKFEIAIQQEIELLADSDHVQRVLENLNRNAVQALIEAGPGRGRPATIRYSAVRAPDGVTIEVADTGPGVPARLGQAAFEPFHGSTRDGGSGLGLAIAADLVEKNGGSIILAPPQAEAYYCGARFVIILPGAAWAAPALVAMAPQA